MGLLNATDRFNTFMSGISPEANLGLLTGGLSLLGGEPIGKAINTGMGMYSNLQGFGDKNKQRSAIKELEEKFKDQPKMLALLKANPTGFIQALTTSTLTPKTPVANFKDLTNSEKIELGLPTYVSVQRNTATGKLEIKSPYADTNLDVLQSLQATNQTPTNQSDTGGALGTVGTVGTVGTSQSDTSDTSGALGNVETPVKKDIKSLNLTDGTATVQADNALGLEIMPIPGSKIDLAQKAENKANLNYYNNLGKRVGVLNREIDKALQILEPHEGFLGSWGLGTGAGIESLLSRLPSSQAKELSATLDTIKGIVGFERLGEMRQESVTGGALGAINTAELNLLTSSQGSLEQGLTPDSLRKNLLQLRANYAETQIKADEAYETQFGEAPPDRFNDEDNSDLSSFPPKFKRLMGAEYTDEQLATAWETLTDEYRDAFK